MSAGPSRLRYGWKVGLCAVPLVVASCVGSTTVDSVLVKTLSGRSELFAPARPGNVVISHTNHTDTPVQWTVSWQKDDAAEPDVFVVTAEPGQTGSVAVEGPVKAITVGSFDGRTPAAVVAPGSDKPVPVSSQGPVLLAGVDFHDGDIVSYAIAGQPGGRFVITVEITAGG